jgi:hypothetical protein
MLGDAVLNKLGKELLEDLIHNAVSRTRRRKGGSTREEINFRVGLSKELIDQIDIKLAQHYGLTPIQLDYIINYDIKYRMGQGDEDA